MINISFFTFAQQEMGKIIQRDFFPDLEKLKAQNEYLEAMERNDVSKLRELHLKYSGRRPPTERSKSIVLIHFFFKQNGFKYF